MKGFIFKGIIFLFSISIAFAQEKITPFDSVFNHVVFNVIGNDVAKAKHITDSLFKHAIDGRQKIKALMLLGTISIQENLHEEAMIFAFRAEKIAQKEKDFEWQMRTAGFLSSIFRDANLIVEAREHLKVVEVASEKLRNNTNYNLIQVNIYHEKAHFDRKDGDNKLAIQELQTAQKYISLLDEKIQGGYFSNNYLMLGENYLELNDYENSTKYYQLALNDKVPNENANYTSIYRGLGDIALRNKNYEQAFLYLKKAEEYVPINQHFTYSIPVYKSLSSYYKQVDLPREALYYDSLHLEGVKSMASFTERLSNRLVQNHLSERSLANRRNTFFYGALGLLALLVLLLFVRLRILKKKEKQLYEAFIEKAQKTPSLDSNGSHSLSKKSLEFPEGAMMPRETEERLLKELSKMEAEEFFLQKDISLSSLATQLQSNPKYVSYIVNAHKGKDFNNYVNELRVRFVIHKFQNNPEFLKYKFAFIADLCGFSSHSKFAAVFKSITDLSPSAFISQLKQEQKK